MKNVDNAEIEKFNKIASEWWDLDGKFKPLHTLNETRIQFIQEIAPLKSIKSLDVGCGGGILTEMLCKNGAKTFAIDMAEQALEIAKNHASEHNLDINYILSTAENYSLNNHNSFDVVTCMEMLEHVPEPYDVIAACSQMLKVGGTAFFSTLNRSIPSFLFSIVGAEYVLNLLPKGTHSYEKYIKPSELCKMCADVGLDMIEVKGISYNPVLNSSKLSNNLSVNYIAAFTKTN